MKKLLLILIFILLLGELVYGAIITIPDEYPTIQLAIDASEAQDTVLINPGIYYETLSIISHAITLASLDIYGVQNPPAVETTIIDGSENLASDRALITISDCPNDSVRIIGLSLRNGSNFASTSDRRGGGIKCNSSNLYISKCTILDNIAFLGAGIYANTSDLIIQNSTIDGNYSGNGGGIFTYESNVNIEANTVSNNESTENGGGGGIWGNSSRGIISRNIIRSNSCFHRGGGIYLNGTWQVDNNLFVENSSNIFSGGIHFAGTDSITVKNNIFLDNSAFDTTRAYYDGYGGAISIQNTGSYSKVEHNSFFNNIGLRYGGCATLMGDSIEFIENVLIGNNSRGAGAIKFMSSNNIQSDIFVTRNIIKYSHSMLEYPWGYRGAIVRGYDSIGNIFENDIHGNFISATGTNTEGGEVNLLNNYWGHESGPYHEIQNPNGQGDTVHTDHDIIPFATEPFWDYGLEFNLDVLDFGYVPPNESDVQYVELTNTLNEELMIFRLLWVFDSVFEAPDMDSLIIMPFETIEVPVTFTPIDTINYYDILSTVAYDHRASGSTIEFIGTGHFNSTEEETSNIPTRMSVSDLYPNPFNSNSNLKVFLPHPSHIKIKVYNIHGKEVKLVADSFVNRGESLFNVNMESFSSGIYFVKIQAGKSTIIKKMLLIA